DGNAGFDRSLADRNRRVTHIAGAVETIAAKIHRIRTARTKGQRRVEEHTVTATDAVRGAPTAEEAPRAADRGYARKAYLAPRRIEKRVIHRHVCGVSGALIDCRETAIAAVSASPASARLQEFGPVVLSAPDGEICIRGMHCHAFKLGCIEAGSVAAGPGRSTIGRAEDAAVVALIHNERVGGRDGNGVGISMQRILAGGEGRSTIGGFSEATVAA